MKILSIFRKRSTERNKSKSPQESNVPSRLLQLPPELRNKIYAYVLCSQSPVNIDTRYREPPLLLVSHQLRHEALPIYYFQNTFHTTILDCDATTLLHFWTRVLNVQEKYPGAGFVPLTVEVLGRADWTNLMVWCRRVFEDRERALVWAAGGDEYTAVIAAALEIAADANCSEWKHVAAGLEFLRVAAGRVDREWLEGSRGLVDW